MNRALFTVLTWAIKMFYPGYLFTSFRTLSMSWKLFQYVPISWILVCVLYIFFLSVLFCSVFASSSHCNFLYLAGAAAAAAADFHSVKNKRDEKKNENYLQHEHGKFARHNERTDENAWTRERKKAQRICGQSVELTGSWPEYGRNFGKTHAHTNTHVCQRENERTNGFSG